ncbi:hypothetical protein PR048_002217 [Dryococelus australis]|uniref:Maturase K n=1 Tax=Dryococelus australis TaxID=614101 RepID=A0ABQ9IKN0_9NEOP|nr:hypothetical protein PR048_002217 [Dryococelus australis]
MHKYFYSHHDREGQQNFVLHLVYINRLFKTYAENFCNLVTCPWMDVDVTKYPSIIQMKRQSIKELIKFITVLESHYCCSRNITRQYLPSKLSIKSLWFKYQESCEQNLHGKYDNFRSIFGNDFSIGFGSPATDCCSLCLSLKEHIKRYTGKQQENDLQTELTINEKRANAFYELLRHSSEQEISFYCQKTSLFQKFQNESAYYLRQLYLYNFTICLGHSKEIQGKYKTFSYCPPISINVHRLCKLFISQVGCRWYALQISGRRRSCISDTNNFDISCGLHSLISPERIFGRIEYEIKKHATILTRQDYGTVIESHTTLTRLRDDCPEL